VPHPGRGSEVLTAEVQHGARAAALIGRKSQSRQWFLTLEQGWS
jgi:hypothetical protein